MSPLHRFASKGLDRHPVDSNMQIYLNYIPIGVLIGYSAYTGVSFWRYVICAD